MAQPSATGAAPPVLPNSLPGALPLLGDSSDMTSAAERRLGDRIARELMRDPDYLDDAVLGDYVQAIWQSLLTAARQRGDLTPELDERFAWQIFLGRDRSVNAFALPGGYMGVHLGLLAVVENRDELASVLAHELSHITQRHISRLLSKTSQQAPWLMGAMILGALTASKNAEAANALIVGGQALAAQSQLNFSREMEREADRIGYSVLTQAQFSPHGFVSMFDKLQQAAKLNDNGSYPYLRTHPLTTERIADMQSRLPVALSPAPQPTLEHAMLAARAKVLADASPQALRSWQVQADEVALATLSPARQAGLLYGSALAASRIREPALATQQLQRLQTRLAADPQALRQARWLALELALASGHATPAEWLALTQEIGLSSPAGKPRASAASVPRAQRLLQARLALELNQPEMLAEVAQALQSWLAENAKDALAWQLLADIYSAQQQSLRALRAQAEARAAQLDYAGALDRLKAAQDRVRASQFSSASADHIEASIIDARRRQIETLLKEQLR